MTNVFYGIYIHDIRVTTCFDAIRLVCDPTVLGHSHVTIRGPYSRKNYGKNLLWKQFPAQEVYISCAGSFFEHNQNTVFLKCKVPHLDKVQWKPSYPNGISHITLYDGSSRHFAEELIDVLKKFDWRMTVMSGLIQILRECQPSEELITWYNMKALEKEGDLDLSWKNVVKMDRPMRLAYVAKLCRMLREPPSNEKWILGVSGNRLPQR